MWINDQQKKYSRANGRVCATVYLATKTTINLISTLVTPQTSSFPISAIPSCLPTCLKKMYGNNGTQTLGGASKFKFFL